ncbi:hypothetical protein V8E55_011286 [Tylopilus felleus]
MNSPDLEGSNALQLGPRKKPSTQDLLVHHGCHFGRAIYAFCNVEMLITNGLLAMSDGISEELLTAIERKECVVFRELLGIILGLENRLMNLLEEEVIVIMDLIQKGAKGARVDDTNISKPAYLGYRVSDL